MYLLGLACFYHDSSATIIKDGRMIGAAQEERWTRKKHDISFPINAIKYCLIEAGITMKDIDCIAFYEKPLLKFDRLLSSHLEMFPKSLKTFVQAMPSWVKEKLRLSTLLRKRCGYKGEVCFVEHHLAHAAGSFFVSPFKEAAILTTDGVGEWATTTLGIGSANKIKILKEIHFPHSLGLLYSTVTGYLGFKVNNDEYKIMGLSPYGQPIYYEHFKKIIDVKEDGSYRQDMRYFAYHYKERMHNRKFVELFGPERKKEAPLEQRHKDIAASLQKIVEEVYFKMLKHLYELTETENLCISGGIALNGVANGKITKQTPFKNVYVPPAPSDAGSSHGAALAVWHMGLENKQRATLESAFFGPSYDDDYIENFLKNSRIQYQKLSEEELVKKIAKLLSEDNVVAWFHGRMEFGERALGARSILANPCNPKMRDILNLKVKHRESFRPFAPAVPLNDAKKYFEIDMEVPFMSFVYPVKSEFHKCLPATTHVDGTARLQTVSDNQNKLYYELLKEFEKLTGFPIVVNTSFNIRGEPIVMTPEQAYRCFTGTEIDYLAMGRFLVDRNENKKDWWNSESLAKD